MTFADNFLWGVATSAYQVEGGLENDHDEWEKAGKFDNNGDHIYCGEAVNHWEKWEEDFRLLKELGVNAYRFSIAWERIVPQKGKIDFSAVSQYKAMFEYLMDAGITPVVTLHHFTNPLWFQQQSPWHESASVNPFLEFVDIVLEHFGRYLTHLITFNEPIVWLLAAYAQGVFPPGYKDLKLFAAALTNILESHRLSYKKIKTFNPDIQVGIAKNFIIFKPYRINNLFDRKLKRYVSDLYNHMLINAFTDNQIDLQFPGLISYNVKMELNNCLDFWGVNYYYRYHIKLKLSFKTPFELIFKTDTKHGNSDLGWEIYPKGLNKIFRWLKRTNIPIMVTENGIASSKEKTRIKFMKKHLKRLVKAGNQNIPIIGYFVWSLLDNFEWLIGTEAKFGLIGVDRDNDFSRTPKKSFYFYKKFIEKERLNAN